MAGLPRGLLRPGLSLLLIASGVGPGRPAFAETGDADGVVTAYPLPATAQEAYSPIGEGFESPLEAREDLKGPKPYIDEREERLRPQREQQPEAPFFRDTELAANSRTYWFGEDAFGNARPEALTTGGYLSYQSGFVADFLQLRGVLYTTQPLTASEDAGATLNLTEDGDQITTLGQINARMTFANQELTVGRQLVRTPYVNTFDARMIPLTFEGIALLPERKDQTFEYIASYLWRYKPRDQTGSSSPACAGAPRRGTTGLRTIGSRIRSTPPMSRSTICCLLAAARGSRACASASTISTSEAWGRT